LYLERWQHDELCSCREISPAWCVQVAWVAFCLFLLAFTFWQFLARSMRNEKAKAII
jgi:hypothetical protein